MKNVINVFKDLKIPTFAPGYNGISLLKNLFNGLVIASVVSGCNGLPYPNINPTFAPKAPTLNSTKFDENNITPEDGAHIITNLTGGPLTIDVTKAFPAEAINEEIHYMIERLDIPWIFFSLWGEVPIQDVNAYCFFVETDSKFYYYFTYERQGREIKTNTRTMIITVDKNLLPAVTNSPNFPTVDNSKINCRIDDGNVVNLSWGDAFKVGGDPCNCGPNRSFTLNFSVFASPNEALVNNVDNPDPLATVHRGQDTSCKWPFDGRALYCRIFAWNNYGKVSSEIFKITR